MNALHYYHCEKFKDIWKMLPIWFTHCEGVWRYLKMHYIRWCQTESEYLTPSPEWPQATCTASGPWGQIESVWSCDDGLVTLVKVCGLLWKVWWPKSVLWWAFYGIVHQKISILSLTESHVIPNLYAVNLLLWNTQILMQLSVKQDILVNCLPFYSLNHAMTYRMSHVEYFFRSCGGGLSHGVL